jgi:cytochrome P450
MTRTLKRWLPVLPSSSLRKLFEGRQACANLASKCVKKRLAVLADIKGDDAAIKKQRKDILTSLILAKHPDTGERLTKTDLETEAFGFM